MLSVKTLSVKRRNISYEGYDLGKVQTPCFVFSKKGIVHQYRSLLEAFSGVIPTEIAYCVKTNSDTGILQVLEKEKSSFMVCSLEELQLLRKNVKKSSVVYVNPFLSQEEFLFALKLGVTRFVVESKDQFSFIKKIMRKKSFEKEIELLVRVTTETATNGLYPNNNSFGMEIADAIDILEEAFQHKNITKIGIHNHMTSQNTTLGSWERTLKMLLGMGKQLSMQGVSIDYLDVGGGFPVDYGGGLPSFSSIVETVSYGVVALQNVFPSLQLILEPGRFLVGPAGILVTSVIDVKGSIVTVDASVYNASMDSIIVGLQLPVQTNATGKKVKQLIRGKTPDSLDVFRKEVLMPQVKKGDKILFLQAGAYTFSSDFLHLKKPEVKII